ncbi:MAG: hypothetical protein AAF360_13385, partial [Pseudomonadota bacterium]
MSTHNCNAPHTRRSELTRREVLAGSAATAACLLISAAGVARAQLVAPAQQGIGAAYPRRDGPLKVRGGARFAAEHRCPEMTYGAIVFSTIARGTIRKIDDEAARQAPGVVLVMTHENAPRLGPPEPFYASPTGMAG